MITKETARQNESPTRASNLDTSSAEIVHEGGGKIEKMKKNEPLIKYMFDTIDGGVEFVRG